MRRVTTILLFLLFTAAAVAQNVQHVTGFVHTSDGNPIIGATVKAVGEDIAVKTSQGGKFEMEVSSSCNFIEVSADGFISQKQNLDGSLILLRLKVDKKYVEQKAKADEKARIAAEKEAAEKAKAEEKARVEAEKEAEAKRIADEKEAAEKAKAEEKARIAAEKEAEAKRIADEKEAAEKAKAEEKARIAAEKEAAEKAKAEEKARLAAEKETETKAKAEEPIHTTNSLRLKLKENLIHMVELTSKTCYNASYSGKGISYTAGYQLNKMFRVGVGAGLTYNTYGGSKDPLVSYDGYYYRTNNVYPHYISIPIFAYFRATFLDDRWSPFVALSAGGNVSPNQTWSLNWTDIKYNTSSIFANPQVGVNFRATNKMSIYLAFGVQCFRAYKVVGYTLDNGLLVNAILKPKCGYGTDFHIGITF